MADSLRPWSPCTREYASFRQEFQRVKRLQALGAIAVAVVLAVIAGWLALGKFGSRGESWRSQSRSERARGLSRGWGTKDGAA
jgi:hypothetical protein